MVLCFYGVINIYYSEGVGIVDELDLKRFKKIISQLESSGNKFTNHKEMKTGMHKGSRAIGQYGLMPVTIQDAAKMRIKNGTADELDLQIANMSIDEVKKTVPKLVQNDSPEYEKYADTLAAHVLNKYDDPEAAAFAWNQGHYTNPDKIKKMMVSPKTEHQKNYLPRLRRAMALVDRQSTADKAFATTKGVMELDPNKSEFARNSEVDVEAPYKDRFTPDLSRLPASTTFISPSDEIETEEVESPVSGFQNLLSKLVDPSTISYKKKKKEEET